LLIAGKWNTHIISGRPGHHEFVPSIQPDTFWSRIHSRLLQDSVHHSVSFHLTSARSRGYFYHRSAACGLPDVRHYHRGQAMGLRNKGGPRGMVGGLQCSPCFAQGPEKRQDGGLQSDERRSSRGGRRVGGLHQRMPSCNPVQVHLLFAAPVGDGYVLARVMPFLSLLLEGAYCWSSFRCSSRGMHFVLF